MYQAVLRCRAYRYADSILGVACSLETHVRIAQSWCGIAAISIVELWRRSNQYLRSPLERQQTPSSACRCWCLESQDRSSSLFREFWFMFWCGIGRVARLGSAEQEPPQIYGSNQIELSWTVIPVLIVVMLFLATTRVIYTTEHAQRPSNALDVTVIGHQFWWEYRYPKLGIVTANELHVPVSDPKHPLPTYLTMSSADTDHSFWVPELAGKMDVIPNKVNTMWIDPQTNGSLPRPMCAILRGPACEDADSRVCRHPRSNSPRGWRISRSRQWMIRQLPRDGKYSCTTRASVVTRFAGQWRRADLVRTSPMLRAETRSLLVRCQTRRRIFGTSSITLPTSNREL